MLSADYSQLFSSGIRMIAHRAMPNRRRRMSQPTAPNHDVSYISFVEPDTPLEPSPLPVVASWRTALRRMSTAAAWKPSASRRARRTTVPADFTIKAESAWTVDEPSSYHDVLASIVHEDDDRTSTNSSSITEIEKPIQRRHRPTPLLIIATSPTTTTTCIPSTTLDNNNSPVDFLSLSTTSTEFPSPRLMSARPRTMSLSLACHPYALGGGRPTPVDIDYDGVDGQDWRRFHENVEWDVIA